MQCVLLHGGRATELGAVTYASPAPGLAAALSPGRLPKQPPSVDPNEDGALVAAAGGRALLAAVDAHYGAISGEAALRTLAEGAADLLQAEDSSLQGRLAALLDDVVSEVAIAVRAQPSSATALSVALVDRGRVLTVTVGDTVVVRVPERGRARRLGRSTPFLGAYAPPVAVDVTRLRRGDRVLVATDGLTGYLGSSPLGRIAAQVRRAAPSAAVRALVDDAFAAGAGDHIAIGLWAPLGEADR